MGDAMPSMARELPLGTSGPHIMCGRSETAARQCRARSIIPIGKPMPSMAKHLRLLNAGPHILVRAFADARGNAADIRFDQHGAAIPGDESRVSERPARTSMCRRSGQPRGSAARACCPSPLDTHHLAQGVPTSTRSLCAAITASMSL